LQPGFEYQGWYGALAPSKTPRPIINLPVKKIAQILACSDIQQSLSNQGGIAKSSSPEAFEKLVHEGIATRREV
jgi:tripartite-type tricarboxylate transporter receptor subunit TctC